MYEKLHKFGVVEILMSVGMALITVGVGLGIKTKIDPPKETLVKSGGVATVTQGYNKVTFDISGEVLKPGVYQLSGGARVGEAMAVAGGLSLNADRDWVEKNINRAKRVNDGEKIYIPRKNRNEELGIRNESSIQKTGQVLSGESGGLVSINNAGVEELDKLEGVGPAMAQKIIDYRQRMGGFKDINELKLVSGIGDKMFAKIKDRVGL
jgi:competence protein ComEA